MGNEEVLKDFFEKHAKSINDTVENGIKKLKSEGGFLAGPICCIIEMFGHVFKKQTEHNTRILRLEQSYENVVRLADAMVRQSELMSKMAGAVDEISLKIKELEGKNEKHN